MLDNEEPIQNCCIVNQSGVLGFCGSRSRYLGPTDRQRRQDTPGNMATIRKHPNAIGETPVRFGFGEVEAEFEAEIG